MRGDWMDEARRFEDTDKAIMESLARENDYWKRVGGHPPAGHMDAPPVYECEADGCTHHAMSVEEAPYGDMEQCPDCESYFCPAHLTHGPKGQYREQVCFPCAHQRDIARLAVESD